MHKVYFHFIHFSVYFQTTFMFDDHFCIVCELLHPRPLAHVFRAESQDKQVTYQNFSLLHVAMTFALLLLLFKETSTGIQCILVC